MFLYGAYRGESKSCHVFCQVNDSNGFDALGCDGFNFKCIKKALRTIKEHFLEFMSEFHGNGKILNGFNSTFMSLILKVEHPTNFKGQVGWGELIKYFPKFC